MMMICETRVEPFDVLIKKRMTNMTSVDCITQLVDETEVNRKEGDTQWRKRTSSEKTAILKNSSLKQSFKLIQFILELFKSSASIVL